MIFTFFLKTGMIILFLAMPIIATGMDYQRIENEHFIIQYIKDDEGIARNIERKSEKIRKKIIEDIGIDLEKKTEVILSPTIEEFQRVQPGGRWIPLWAAGIAYPGKNLIVIRSPRSVKGGRIDYLNIFAHEFTHIAIGEALKGESVPVWLNEGLAIYESLEWNFSRHATLTRAVLTGRLIPLPVLTLSFPTDENLAELAYAESFMFISFIINKIGKEAFHRFIRNYSRSGDLEGSLQRATGMSIPVLEEKWLLYLKMRASWIPIIVSATSLWFIASLIFIYGYFRKRRQARTKIMAWEEEEKTEFH